MTVKIGINGFGRIGRLVLRNSLVEGGIANISGPDQQLLQILPNYLAR